MKATKRALIRHIRTWTRNELVLLVVAVTFVVFVLGCLLVRHLVHNDIWSGKYPVDYSERTFHPTCATRLCADKWSFLTTGQEPIVHDHLPCTQDCPYLSIVLAAQVSGYGGKRRSNMERLQQSLDNWAWQVKRTGFTDYEIIVVEWNPQPLQSTVLSSISWPDVIPLVRIITVSSLKAHQTSDLAVNELHAKNIALRRAHGRFVLFSSTDCLGGLNDVFHKFISARQLRSDVYYVQERLDLPSLEWLLELKPAEWSAMAPFVEYERNAQQLRGAPYWNMTDVLWGAWAYVAGGNVKEYTFATGDFLVCSVQAAVAAGGYHESHKYWTHVDTIFVYSLARSLRQVVLPPPFAMYHIHHARRQHDREADYKWWHSTFSNHKDFKYNSGDWGRREDDELPTTQVRKGLTISN